jgi:hypothetical protein
LDNCKNFLSHIVQSQLQISAPQIILPTEEIM